MSMSIQLGTWGIPLVLTIILLGAAWAWDAGQKPSYGYAKAGAAAVSAIGWLCAIVLCLIVWLVWTLL